MKPRRHHCTYRALALRHDTRVPTCHDPALGAGYLCARHEMLQLRIDSLARFAELVEMQRQARAEVRAERAGVA